MGSFFVAALLDSPRRLVRAMRFGLRLLFEGLVGVLLTTSLLLLGSLFGLSIAVLSRGITGETLIGLWGPALGASIGATATLGTMLYSQRIIELRELREPINELTTLLELVVDQAIELSAMFDVPVDPENYDHRMSRRNEMIMRLSRLASEASRIEPKPTLPFRLRREVRIALAAAQTAIEMAMTEAKEDLPIAEGEDYVRRWLKLRSYTDRVANHLAEQIERLVELT